MMRPTWDEFYLGIAQAASVRGDCTRSQVGAIIVLRTSTQHWTSIGYNGTYAGELGCIDGGCPRGRKSYAELPSNSDYSDCIAFHAEVNAARNAQFDVYGADCYVTREPCPDCQRQLFDGGIRSFVYPNGFIKHP